MSLFDVTVHFEDGTKVECKGINFQTAPLKDRVAFEMSPYFRNNAADSGTTAVAFFLWCRLLRGAGPRVAGADFDAFLELVDTYDLRLVDEPSTSSEEGEDEPDPPTDLLNPS